MEYPPGDPSRLASTLGHYIPNNVLYGSIAITGIVILILHFIILTISLKVLKIKWNFFKTLILSILFFSINFIIQIFQTSFLYIGGLILLTAATVFALIKLYNASIKNVIIIIIIQGLFILPISIISLQTIIDYITRLF